MDKNGDVLENVLMPMLQNVIKRLNQLDSRISVLEQKLAPPIKVYKGVNNGSGSVSDAD
jgi:hypothetical protein